MLSKCFQKRAALGCSPLALFPGELQSPLQLFPVGLTLLLVCCSCAPLMCQSTHGSGVYMGLEEWRMYCVEWNTRNASPARKSREDSKPATGRSRNPVQPEGTQRQHLKNCWCVWFILIQTPHSRKTLWTVVLGFLNFLTCAGFALMPNSTLCYTEFN